MRALPHGLIEFSPPLREAQLALKRFLRDALYTHPHVRQMTEQAQETVALPLHGAHGRLRPHARGARRARARTLAAAGDAAGAARVVADYIAGMTDRFALQTRDAPARANASGC